MMGESDYIKFCITWALAVKIGIFFFQETTSHLTNFFVKSVKEE